MEAWYADAIPLDVVKSEQERITRELAGGQQIIDRCSTEIDAVMKVVEEALPLCVNAHRLYLSAPPDVRRQLNSPANQESSQRTSDRAWTRVPALVFPSVFPRSAAAGAGRRPTRLVDFPGSRTWGQAVLIRTTASRHVRRAAH